MAVLTVQKTNQSGITPAYTPASDMSDQFFNDGNTIIFIKNNGESSVSVQINAQSVCDYVAIHDLLIDVPALTTMAFGVFSPRFFNNAENKVVLFYLADMSSTQIAAISI